VNIFGGLVLYLAVGGALCGWAMNSKYEECGIPVSINNDTVIGVIIWPVSFGLAATIDDGVIKKLGCKANEGNNNE